VTSEAVPRTLEVPAVDVVARDGRAMPATAPEVPPPDIPIKPPKVTSDDVYTVVGSLLGSFALVWLLYFQILPLSGVVGFVVCWFAGFLAMYSGVTAIGHPRTVVVDRLVGAVVVGVAVLLVCTLVSVVLYTIWRAWPALHHLNFFTQSASAGSLIGPYNKGGIANAIIGSLIVVSIAVCISLPLGVGTAVYMTEVGGWFSRIVRTVVEAMTAIPDLLAGLFVYVVLILHFSGSKNGLTGHKNGLAVAIALSVTGTPIIARSAEVALRVVPGGLRQASHALGASHWQTVRRIVLPTARPGLATALILAIARMIGESAPLLIVSGFTTYWESNPISTHPMNSLPLYTYEGVRSGEPRQITRAFAAAAVLLMIVFVLFIVMRLLARQRVSRR
jgi:phosphate transport system permease protein